MAGIGNATYDPASPGTSLPTWPGLSSQGSGSRYGSVTKYLWHPPAIWRVRIMLCAIQCCGLPRFQGVIRAGRYGYLSGNKKPSHCISARGEMGRLSHHPPSQVSEGFQVGLRILASGLAYSPCLPTSIPEAVAAIRISSPVTDAGQRRILTVFRRETLLPSGSYLVDLG